MSAKYDDLNALGYLVLAYDAPKGKEILNRPTADWHVGVVHVQELFGELSLMDRLKDVFLHLPKSKHETSAKTERTQRDFMSCDKTKETEETESASPLSVLSPVECFATLG